MKTSQGSSVMQ